MTAAIIPTAVDPVAADVVASDPAAFVPPATVADAATPVDRTGGVWAGLLRSEWTKLRSVRSTVWALLLLVVLSVGFSALLLGLTVAQWDDPNPARRLQILADPTRAILGTGFQFSQLAVCVLGVLVMSSEYSRGTIRASLLAVLGRTPMLVAKAIVFSAVVFVVGEIAAFMSFALGAKILHAKVSVGLGDAGVLRAVVGAGLYMAVLGVFSIAVGAIVRHTAGGITGIIGFVLVVAPLASLLPGTIGAHIHAYLPTEAGQLIATVQRASDQLLTPAGLWRLLPLDTGSNDPGGLPPSPPRRLTDRNARGSNLRTQPPTSSEHFRMLGDHLRTYVRL